MIHHIYYSVLLDTVLMGTVYLLLFLPFTTFYTQNPIFIGREIVLITSYLFHCINHLLLSSIAPKNVHFEESSMW